MTGIGVWLILTLLGVEMALVFGLFAFLLNFVPNVGSLVATLMPLPIVLLGDYSTSVQVLAIILPGGVQFMVGNWLEPKLLGDSMDLHPVTILLALIFWGMVWGLVGALLATPLTAIVRILLDKEEITRPVAELMAGRLPSSASPAPTEP
jgi:AI-2 transport protein TqsA